MAKVGFGDSSSIARRTKPTCTGTARLFALPLLVAFGFACGSNAAGDGPGTPAAGASALPQAGASSGGAGSGGSAGSSPSVAGSGGASAGAAPAGGGAEVGGSSGASGATGLGGLGGATAGSGGATAGSGGASAGAVGTWKNPILPGYNADPQIAMFGGKFYIYPTTDGFANWLGTNFHAWSSPDLVKWTDEGVVLDLGPGVSWADD
ncbi:MAG TPA: family 43 glycosylhydrolase, partial [Polyangiaceae bacterium]